MPTDGQLTFLPDDQKDRLIPAKHVAAILGVHQRTVLRYLEAGELAGYDYGHRRPKRIFESSVYAFLARSRVHPRPVAC